MVKSWFRCMKFPSFPWQLQSWGINDSSTASSLWRPQIPRGLGWPLGPVGAWKNWGKKHQFNGFSPNSTKLKWNSVKTAYGKKKHHLLSNRRNEIPLNGHCPNFGHADLKNRREHLSGLSLFFNRPLWQRHSYTVAGHTMLGDMIVISSKQMRIPTTKYETVRMIMI